MKKTFLTVAFIAIVMSSCKDSTKEKIEDATEATQTEIEQKLDSAAEKTEIAVDTTKAKIEEVAKKGAEKIDNAADQLKEAVKK